MTSSSAAPLGAPSPANAFAQRTTREWQMADQGHHLHPFTDHRTLHGEGSRIIVRGEGPYIWDSEGHRILDGMAGLWCVNIGYGRRELADVAYRQMMELPYYNSFFKCTTPTPILLAERLAKLAGGGLNRVFYGSSGSEANDTAVRLVRYYWAQMGRPEKQVIISRKYAYHGSTITGSSLGGSAAMHKQGGTIPGIAHVTAPYWYGLGGDMSPDEFGRAAAKAIEDKILELGPENVAAFHGEPIQGAGGVIIPPASYWPEVQRICRQYDVLLVADEVITAYGRLGRWFGSQYFGVEPDLILTAKALTSGYIPLSAVLVGDRVAEALVNQDGEFYHGYTYSGHPVACAVALANLDILENERLVEGADTGVGAYFRRRIAELADHPLVGEVRSAGVVAAIELSPDKARRAFFPEKDEGKVGLVCRDHCFRNDLVMRAVRDTMILSPPLVWHNDQVDELLTKARIALDLTAKDIGL